MEYVEYLATAWYYAPYIFYTFVFLTLVPKSLSKINQFAKADYEANRNKWHRCYAPDICCHNLTEVGESLPKQKPRKAVTRVYPKKQAAKNETAAKHTPSVPVEPANIYKRQVHTHTNVNKIAKMFENGGVQKKINRVTPTLLPSDFRRASMDFDDEECFHKNREYSSQSHESPLKKENVVLRRLSKLTQEMEENNENSSNILNQMAHEEKNDLHNSSWRSEPIPIQRQKRQVSSNLLINGSSATPSTVSPAHSSPLSSPRSCNSPVPSSSPILRNAPILNMNTSLEDLFVAIAKSAENSDGFLYAGTSLSPVTSIDDILSQRRLSRPLSAYSISDLLNDEPNKGMDETYVENFLKVLNKT